MKKLEWGALSGKCLTIQAVSREGAGKNEVARDVGRVAWRKNPVKGGAIDRVSTSLRGTSGPGSPYLCLYLEWA